MLVASLVDLGHDGRWFRAALTQDGLCAPAHVLAEATNALRRMELSGRIARVQAAAAHRDLLRDNYTLHPFAPFAERVWELRTTLTITMRGTSPLQRRWAARLQRSTAD